MIGRSSGILSPIGNKQTLLERERSKDGTLRKRRQLCNLNFRIFEKWAPQEEEQGRGLGGGVVVCGGPKFDADV